MDGTVSVMTAAANACMIKRRNKRRKAEAQGRRAETFVAEHWQAQGFNVLGLRQRTLAGEIDLIVADPETLVFIEVKSRNNFALAAHAVSPRQQSRLLDAAASILADHDDWSRPNIRFDIALVCNGAIEHIHDALRRF